MKLINSVIIASFILLLILDFSNLKLEENVYTLDFDSKDWSYDSDNKVYYQIGVVYCTNPVDIDYQSLAIFVPEEYMKCSESSGKYSCSINSSGKKDSYTSKNAPYVMPVETPGYSSMKALSSYNYKTISSFVSKGLIYIYAGCRGRYEGSESYAAGSPWPITDLKSAIRFLRYNSKLLPGDLNRFYTFGMSGGGAQSCLMGITGNSALFNEYLKSNGAAMKDSNGKEIKDNVKGSQCWCPITNLDTADAAYEWNIGQYLSIDTRKEGTFTKELSNDLAQTFVEYINKLKLKDSKGNELTLKDTNSGTYYDYLLNIIQESLNNFLSDTTFPYEKKEGGDDFPPGPPSNMRSLSTIYENIDEYIEDLNSDSETPWVSYDKSTKKAKITSIKDFIIHCKSTNAKSVGAFDDLNKKQAENKVFGVDGTNYAKHFDKTMADLLSKNKDKYSKLENWDSQYPESYANDLSLKDDLGKTIEERVCMYNPMYYLNNYYDGYKKSDVADYFRINTGISQVDTGNVVEMNLYLALLNYGKDAQFTTVWEQKHVEAERTGTSDDNFISWVFNIETKKSSGKYINYNSLLLFAIFLLLI